MAPSPESLCVYQFRFVLRVVSPLVWRRLLVSSDTSIGQLHEVLQIAFSWGGEHLHCFRIHGKAYGIAYAGGVHFRDEPHRVRLSSFRLRRRECFRYQYDFTANWELETRLEKILPLNPQKRYPVCVGGKRAAPPEDCAGAWAYLERLDRHRGCPPLEELGVVAEAVQRLVASGGDRQALGDLQELREAVDRLEAYEQFRPERFDRRELNQQLRSLRRQEGVRP
jgi:hypothetical protein